MVEGGKCLVGTGMGKNKNVWGQTLRETCRGKGTEA